MDYVIYVNMKTKRQDPNKPYITYLPIQQQIFLYSKKVHIGGNHLEHQYLEIITEKNKHIWGHKNTEVQDASLTYLAM